MAFGTWMKRIKEGVKNFGNKIKDAAKKVLPVVKKGFEVVENLAPAIGQGVSTIIGGDAGKRAEDVSQRISTWAGGNKNKFLEPVYGAMGMKYDDSQ